MESSINPKIPEALPAAVRAWLSQASQTLIDSLGEDLEALILFGSAAEGLMRASSDVNLLVVLRKFDPDRIDRAGAVLQNAAAAVELHPMFLLGSELPSLVAELGGEWTNDLQSLSRAREDLLPAILAKTRSRYSIHCRSTESRAYIYQEGIGRPARTGETP